MVSIPVGGRKLLAGYGRSRGPSRETPLARRAVEREHSPALRLGWDGDAAFRLAEAAESGSGDMESLDDFYASLPADCEGHLPLREVALMDRLDGIRQ